MKIYSTRQVAAKLGISFPTLNRHLGAKRIPAPRVTILANSKVRLWTQEDIEKAKVALPKIANGRKTRYVKSKNSEARSQKSVGSKAKAKKKAASKSQKKKADSSLRSE